MFKKYVLSIVLFASFCVPAFAQETDASLFEIRLSKIEKINSIKENKIAYPLHTEWGVYFNSADNWASGVSELKKELECFVTENEKENLKNCEAVQIVVEKKASKDTANIVKAYVHYDSDDWRSGSKISIFANPDDFDFVRMDRPARDSLPVGEWVEFAKKKRDEVKECVIKMKDQPIGSVCKVSFGDKKLNYKFQIQKVEKKSDFAYNR